MPTLGGVLIGLSAIGLLTTHGRLAGVSGILGGALDPKSQASPEGEQGRSWRLWFLLGLVVSGVLFGQLKPELFTGAKAGLPLLATAGLLAGFGARTGGGCTSGHGVCGLGSFSKRSLVATLTFMLVAACVVFVTRHVLGSGA